MTQVFEVSTLLGAVTLASALDAGLFDARADGRRLLLVSNNAAVPELVPPVHELPAFAPLRDRFDEVVLVNDVLGVHHPSTWRPADDALDVLGPLLRRHWGLDGPVSELVVESVSVAPARTLARLLPEAAVTVYSEGLMSLGPTRDQLPMTIARRIERVLHVDLVPDLPPLLLGEHAVPAQTMPLDALLPALQASGQACADELDRVGLASGEEHGVLVAQYLSDLGLLTQQEELDLHVGVLRGLASRGLRTVVLKAHPSAPALLGRGLAEAADRLGVRLLTLPAAVPVEAWYLRSRPALVVGCFSTALVTAARLGVPAARMGTGLLLERLRPYENSNRVPAVLVDAVLPPLDPAEDPRPPRGPWGGPVDPALLPDLLATVGYCMQSRTRPDLRPAAERLLAGHGAEVAPYVRRRRLTRLELPGALPARRRSAVARVLRRWTAQRAPVAVQRLAPEVRRVRRVLRRRPEPAAFQ